MSTHKDLIRLMYDVCDDPMVNLERPTTLFSAYNEGDRTDRNLIRAVTRACLNEIAPRYNWQVLRATHQFSTSAAELQADGIPSDLLRPIEGSFWFSTLQMVGPMNDEDYAAVKAGQLAQPWPAVRFEGDNLLIWPIPAAGVTVTYRYLRNAIGTALPGEGQTSRPFISEFTKDTDKVIWDDELVRLGTILEWRKGQQLDTTQAKIDFEEKLASCITADGGSKRLSMSSNSVRVNRPSITIVNPPPIGENT